MVALHACRLPNDADRRLFQWLADELALDGQPPLMLIVGDGGVAVPDIERMEPTYDGYPTELRVVAACDVGLPRFCRHLG
jgi:hypothetical protein